MLALSGPEELLPDTMQLQHPRGAGVSVPPGQHAAAEDPGAGPAGRVHPAHRRASLQRPRLPGGQRPQGGRGEDGLRQSRWCSEAERLEDLCPHFFQAYWFGDQLAK